MICCYRARTLAAGERVARHELEKASLAIYKTVSQLRPPVHTGIARVFLTTKFAILFQAFKFNTVYAKMCPVATRGDEGVRPSASSWSRSASCTEAESTACKANVARRKKR